MPASHKTLTKSEEVSLAQVLAKLVERDSEHHAAWAQLTAKQQDLGRLLEAVLVEQTRMGRALEAQSGYNERQIKLAEQTQAHADTFARAFNDIREIREEGRAFKVDVERLIDGMNQALGSYREKHELTHKEEARPVADLKHDMDAFKGAIKAGIMVMGIIGLLIGIVVNTWRTDYDNRFNKMQTTVDSNTQLITGMRIDMIRPALEQKK